MKIMKKQDNIQSGKEKLRFGRLMTIQDVAHYLNVSDRYVQLNLNKFPFFINVTQGKKGFRARPEKVLDWIKEMESEQNIEITFGS